MKGISCGNHCACYAQYFQILLNMFAYYVILHNIHVYCHTPIWPSVLHPAAQKADEYSDFSPIGFHYFPTKGAFSLDPLSFSPHDISKFRVCHAAFKFRVWPPLYQDRWWFCEGSSY